MASLSGRSTPNGMSEPISGTVKQLNAALHTTMQQVQTAAGAQVVGATEAPELPANLAGAVDLHRRSDPLGAGP